MSSIIYRQYTGEHDLPHIISLVEHELSEPYVVYTYRYFLNQWYDIPHPALRVQLTNSLRLTQAAPLLLSEPPFWILHVIIMSHLRANVLSTLALYRLTPMKVLTPPSAV
jgi:hypothetical protein